MHPRYHPAIPRLLLLFTLPALALPPPAFAQGPQGPAPVGVTEARHHELRKSVQLSGSVESRRASVVASEVAGLVVELGAREGDEVRRGAVLARLRRENLELRLEAARADLKEAEARLDLASRNLERAEELSASGVISRQDFDDAYSEATAWRGRAERLRAEIARVEDDLERSTVRAPFAGVVVRELTQPGEWLAVGGSVMELVDLDDLEVTLPVPERYFASLETGATARITFEAMPGHQVTGRIRAVIPRADPQARTFPVKVAVPNPGHRIGVGMLAQVAFPVGEGYRALVVPKDAVIRRGPRQLVYRVEEEGGVEKAREVEVETGAASGGWIEVEGDLAAGDRVVTRGNERLRPGQEVEPGAVSYGEPGSI